MKINYCLPIIKRTKQEVLETLKNNQEEYDFFEVWLDYIQDCDETFVKALIDTVKNKLIILFRRQKLEKIKMDFEKRKKIISLLNNSNSFLDLDITQKEDLNYAKKNNMHIQIIVSYHNYQEMPINTELTEIIKNMERYKPIIYKIAAMCQTENESLILLELLLKMKDQNKKCIVLGMGEKGNITRVFGTLWGNEMIFAPKEKNEQSASGQLIKQDLENIFTILNC